MDKSTIICHNCKTEIDISQSLYEKLSIQAKNELQKEIEAHRQKYKTAMDDIKNREHLIADKEQKLEEQIKQKTQKLLQNELIKERAKLEADLKEKIELEKSAQLDSLQKELEAKSRQVVELNEKKAEIEKLKREKAEIKSNLKLKAEQELSQKIKEEKLRIAKELQEQNAMKLKEKDEQLEQIKRQLEETKRKADQGSQQIQGEAQEIAIESWLKTHFVYDVIEEVKKGAYGADCIQTVHTPQIQNCGKICYESKNAKRFNKEWISKLKQDMLRINADLGVLVTTVYPNELDRMGLVDGIWVCTLDEFKGSVGLLRETLIRISLSLKKEDNKSDKMTLLYNYLTGNEFSLQLNTIVDGFIKMQEELDKERRSLMASWKRRQKIIDGVLENTTSMYGSLQAIAGNAIAHIDKLELPYDSKESEDE